jgi:hypothetical protein
MTTSYCRVVAAQSFRDGITANCVFTFEMIDSAGHRPAARFHVIYPMSERPGPEHLLLLAVGLRHILRVEVLRDADEGLRYAPRLEDLLPIFHREVVNRWTHTLALRPGSDGRGVDRTQAK